MERIVLAYSGGLDASIAIPWLRDTFSAEVVTVTLDLGQGSELVEIRQRALALGAVRAHVIDVARSSCAITSCRRFRPARCSPIERRWPPR